MLVQEDLGGRDHDEHPALIRVNLSAARPHSALETPGEAAGSEARLSTARRSDPWRSVGSLGCVQLIKQNQVRSSGSAEKPQQRNKCQSRETRSHKSVRPALIDPARATRGGKWAGHTMLAEEEQAEVWYLGPAESCLV